MLQSFATRPQLARRTLPFFSLSSFLRSSSCPFMDTFKYDGALNGKVRSGQVRLGPGLFSLIRGQVVTMLYSCKGWGSWWRYGLSIETVASASPHRPYFVCSILHFLLAAVQVPLDLPPTGGALLPSVWWWRWRWRWQG